ncbi:MAG TPA: plastocyanin/azurin family copper-binding protein [Acidimicrobiia bacterium]|nr:plastocyanin/azurin family copper-binding protein [Acidimicrobiia bacterium]
MQRSFRGLMSVVLVTGALLAGCGGDDKKDDGAKAPKAASSSTPLSGKAPVKIVNFEFKPQKVVVKPGTEVTWTNDDTAIHDVKDTSPLNTPKSKEMAKGDTFSISYASPGTYSYICGIHQYMTGSVEVVP